MYRTGTAAWREFLLPRVRRGGASYTLVDGGIRAFVANAVRIWLRRCPRRADYPERFVSPPLRKS